METPIKRKRTLQRYTAPEFKPYVTALGQLTLAWNALQESFAALFWTMSLTGPPEPGDSINDAPLWIWHSIKSDRSQREMLKAAIEHTSVDWHRSKFKDDAKWLIKEAMNLEDLRNDALHAPLFNSSMPGGSTGKISPDSWLLNPRSMKLSKRGELLSEFRYCRETAIILANYAQEIDSALINQNRPWPDRPSLPTRQHRRAPQSLRPRTK